MAKRQHPPLGTVKRAEDQPQQTHTDLEQTLKPANDGVWEQNEIKMEILKFVHHTGTDQPSCAVAGVVL